VIRQTVAALLLVSAAPSLAQDDPLAPIPETEADDQAPAEPDVPPPASPSQPVAKPVVVPRDWRGVFSAIRSGDWASAQAGIVALPDDGLKAVAKAELYTARNSPRAELQPLLALLGEAPELPKAGQLLRLALARGAAEAELPAVPVPARLVPLGSAPRRHRSRPVEGDAAAEALRQAIEPLVKTDSAEEAEALYQQALPTLTAEGRAQSAQRVAWIYYVLGRDADARRVAETASEGVVGEWVSQANWIAGLASWRLNDCNAAARHFRAVAYGRSETELAAAGAYWAARAEQACRRPQAVEPLLRAAARSTESFYGLLARETLGMEKSLAGGRLPAPGRVENLPNVRRALRLAEIGEYRLADEMLRHQAAIGPASDHLALIALAQRIDFAGVQYFLAHNGRPGTRVPAIARFPFPRWQPSGGWRIDPALAFAHARQESDFRPGAVSQAGAVGLMQVRPGTAGDFARARGTPVGELTYPPTNLEYGQSFIELMRSNPATQGQLLKVVAAYNAGPLPVARWNYIDAKGDPLLWIESLPYWETRYYVPAIMRNLWVYQQLEGLPQPSLKALAQHQWPAFPNRRAGPAPRNASGQ
jgi:soluble lytic murein transglycosylase-like protein